MCSPYLTKCWCVQTKRLGANKQHLILSCFLYSTCAEECSATDIKITYGHNISVRELCKIGKWPLQYFLCPSQQAFLASFIRGQCGAQSNVTKCYHSVSHTIRWRTPWCNQLYFYWNTVTECYSRLYNQIYQSELFSVCFSLITNTKY